MINDRDLADLVTKLKDAAGSNLLSVILYGSAATDEFHEGHSDVEHPLHHAESWPRRSDEVARALGVVGQKRPSRAALLYRRRTSASADIFAIEFLDIKAAHRILHGDDAFTSLDIPMDRHRLQVERELRNNTLRLRQHDSAASRRRQKDAGADDIVHFVIRGVVPAYLDCSGTRAAQRQARNDESPESTIGIRSRALQRDS